MKKKIFITLMLLFMASFCFAVEFAGFPFIDPKRIMSKKEFNEYVIKEREKFKKQNERTDIKWRYHILDDSYKISKYEKNYVINAILNEYDVENGEVYYIMAADSYFIDRYFYTVRIDKVHKSGKVDFTIKAIMITG